MSVPSNAQEVLEEVAKIGARRVKVAITDIDGVMRGKYIHLEKLASALGGGFGFCDVVFGWDSADVCYDAAKFTGWHTGYPDALARLQPSTFRQIPWEQGVPLILADFIDSEGEPLSVCPRSALKRVLSKAESMGFEAFVGMEFEFFNFKETPTSLAEKGGVNPDPLTPGMFGYSMLRSSLNQDYFRDIMELMDDFRVPLEGLHTETGPGVYEAAIKVAPALEAADRAVLFKTGCKEIAYKHGVIPTFMAKWSQEMPGSSGHMHQSLWSEGKNAFYDPDDPDKMSDTFRHFLAGQLQLLPELTPFFAPTVNSYKRLVEGMWAPTRMTWGVENRTSAFRVIPGSNKSTRLETRVGGADVNPYLMAAAGLAAGLYGVENKLELTAPRIYGNAYEAKDAARLPPNLWEATQAMRASTIAPQILGAELVEHLAISREWEWRQFADAVTDWELRRYLEII